MRRVGPTVPAGVRLHRRQVPWDDPTGGLAAPGPGHTDAALVWLPVPHPDRYAWLTVTTEPRLLALPGPHRLAARDTVDISEVLDEPFLALPAISPDQRDHWLAAEARGGHPVVVGAEVGNTEETVEALTAGLGICLIAAGNAPLITRDGITTRPVTGVPPSELVLLWRRDDDRSLLAHLRTAVRQATVGSGPETGRRAPAGGLASPP